MKKPTEQPDIDLVELNVKVVKLAEMVQVRKEELSRRQEEVRIKKEEDEVVAKKAKEEERLKDAFNEGGRFARWIQNRHYSNGESDLSWFKTHTFLKEVGWTDSGDYLKFLRASEHTTEGISESTYMKQGRDRARLRRQELRTDGRKIEGGESGYETIRAIHKEFWVVAHAHMEGFIDTILESNPDTDDLLAAVKVAMIAGVDTFHEFGGRQKILGHLRNTVIHKIEEKLLTGTDIDEEEIKEIERILNEVGEAVKQQVKK